MTPPDPKLVAEFHKAMREIYVLAKAEAGYNATRFKEMVEQQGGLSAAQTLLDKHSGDVSEGFVQLALRGRLDLTVEALVLKEPWCHLFSEQQLKIARRRLSNQADQG